LAAQAHTGGRKGVRSSLCTLSLVSVNDNLLNTETESITGGSAKTVTYTYDSDNNRATIAYPGIATQLHWSQPIQMGKRGSDRLKARKEQHREVPSLRKLQPRVDAQVIIECVAQAYRCAKAQVLKQGRKGNEARAVAMVLIWDCCGMRLREIGELFDGAGYTAVAQMIARTREKDRRNALRFKLSKLTDICVK
jgi:hypothetical protein